MVGINRFFESVLGVPPVNKRWSWGAFDHFKNRLFLRVWADQIKKIAGKEYVLVDRDQYDEGYESPGINERRKQVSMMKNPGVQGYGVVCVPYDESDGNRKIAKYDCNQLLRLGSIIHRNGQSYAQIVERVPVEGLIRNPTPDEKLISDLKKIATRKLGKTQTEALVQARVGQGRFRRDVLMAWENRCSVTGCGVEAAIRASHIKPWASSNDQERLDAENGLPLIASLDALFDAGLISFSSSGEMLISKRIELADRLILGVEGQKLSRPPKHATCKFLEYHRSQFFA